MSTQRRISQKQGFTLIELMVVIVIIGILAAIAIPKLFGMTAKAKAQEVGPAAGTWVKLHQAYVNEHGSQGTWQNIGYIPPGQYTKGDATSTSTYFTYYLGTTPGQWQGTNTGKALGNGCTENNWNATLEFDSTDEGDMPKFSWNSTTQDCKDLTPSFDKLGRQTP